MRKIIILPIIFLLSIFLSGLYTTEAQAATYSYTSSLRTNYNYGRLGWPFAMVFGYNRTHGITKMLRSWITTSGSPYRYIIVNYEVPDDGSTWVASGQIVNYIADEEFTGSGYNPQLIVDLYRDQFEAVHTTGGSFSGSSSKTATDAANTAASNASLSATNSTNAMNAANAANTSATNAYNAVLNANGNTVTAVRDASGTALAEARQAKTNASNASTNAQNAFNEAVNINSKVSTLQTTINGINTTINNISNSVGADTTPPHINLYTVSGARATSGNTIRVVVEVSDNVSTEFTYSTDGTNYSQLPADRIITLNLVTPGLNLFSVWVKDEEGNIASKYISMRKL